MTDRPDLLPDQAPNDLPDDLPEDGSGQSPGHLIERAAARMRALGRAEPFRPAPPQPPPVSTSTLEPAGSGARGHAQAAEPTPVPVVAEAPNATGADPATEASASPAHPLALPAPGMAGSVPALTSEEEEPELALTVLERAGLVVGRSIRTRVSEEFRIAVGRIAWTAEQVGPDGVRNPLTLVTSARPGEGKSFTALNLAAVLAQNGPRPVVLVDTDFKKDGMSDLLGLRGRRGLYDILDGDAPNPRSLLVTTGIRRLSVLPAGRLMEDELGASYTRPLGPRIAALADAFRDCLVVLDAPPCLATSDPSTLAALAGQVLLVVEAGRTQRAEVEAALDFVRACPVVSALLNKVRQSNRQTFGYYDYVSNYQ